MMLVESAEARVSARRNRILEYLGREGRVEVGNLAGQLGVTEETVRRDLRALENRRLLRRAHGGAIGIDVGGARPVPAEWERMAAAAAALVADAPAVFLGAGPVCETLAALLARRPGIQLIVASTSVALAAVLANGDASVHTIGGAVQADGSLTGMWARQQLAGLEVDFSVVEAAGISPDGYLLASDPERAAVHSAAVAASRGVVVLATRDESTGSGSVKFARLSDVDHVVAGPGVLEEDLARFSETDLDVIAIDAEPES
jgi:DeoR family fructose operon transcriptional repressor